MIFEAEQAVYLVDQFCNTLDLIIGSDPES